MTGEEIEQFERSLTAIARSKKADNRVTGTISSVPDKPKTPISSFRIPPDVKAAAARKAEAEGKTLTEVIVKYLDRYGKQK